MILQYNFQLSRTQKFVHNLKKKLITSKNSIDFFLIQKIQENLNIQVFSCFWKEDL